MLRVCYMISICQSYRVGETQCVLKYVHEPPIPSNHNCPTGLGTILKGALLFLESIHVSGGYNFLMQV